MAGGPNLFARLHKWATRQDENFLTESLAVLVEHLLILAPELGTRLVSWLTGGFIDVPSTDASSIEIHTQVEAGKGRPDLEIGTPTRLVWVEVKAEAELRRGQLEGYRELLAIAGVTETRLALLTRYPEEFTAHQERPDLERRWYELADWLETELDALAPASEVVGFLSQQFLEFLRERGMTLTHVDKFMSDGLRAFVNLLNMLVEAGSACKVPLRKSVTWESYGVTIDGPKYWFGVRLTDPDKIWFGTFCQIDPERAARLGVGEVSERAGVPGRYCWWRGAELDSEEVHFFSRSKVGQMQWLEGFLRDCLAKARSIEPDQPPSPEKLEGN